MTLFIGTVVVNYNFYPEIENNPKFISFIGVSLIAWNYFSSKNGYTIGGGGIGICEKHESPSIFKAVVIIKYVIGALILLASMKVKI